MLAEFLKQKKRFKKQLTGTLKIEVETLIKETSSPLPRKKQSVC